MIEAGVTHGVSRAWQRAAPVEPLCGLGFPPHRGETPGREEGPQGLALTRSPGCSSSGSRFPSLWDGAMSPLGASRKARVAPPGSVCPTFQRWFGTGGRSVASGRSCLLDPQVWSGLGLRVLGAPSLPLCWVPRPGTSGASVLTEHSTAPSTLENSCPCPPGLHGPPPSILCSPLSALASCLSESPSSPGQGPVTWHRTQGFLGGEQDGRPGGRREPRVSKGEGCCSGGLYVPAEGCSAPTRVPMLMPTPQEALLLSAPQPWESSSWALFWGA